MARFFVPQVRFPANHIGHKLLKNINSINEDDRKTLNKQYFTIFLFFSRSEIVCANI